ncbi:ESCRT-III subunit protein snf7 [Bacidia gigantensis]|uniref:ESCRT-III subunit protein snf7 n=1 Tax=Bacidia gigantensis TaxID=2732470 RepID=UPI001D05380A|nr:ESCRT-III subunit protein snf7 [Bacidia gigantensis]KAG8529422.1 ESCRT-III subunit protein snf7 [Bacidia gigantensis]
MWGAWFGGQTAQSRKDAPKKAILDLRQQLDMLQKRERHLESQMAQQDKVARESVTSNKTAARNALKRKKQHEHSLEQTAGQIQMLEQQIYSIESANINQETLAAMKNAGQAMKQIHGKMTMEDVDNTMEQLREQHELTQEIGTAITSMPITEPIDEDELEGELAAMEQEKLDNQMLSTGTTVPVGDELDRQHVATNGEKKGKTKVRTEEDDEEEELRKLQAEMAMS